MMKSININNFLNFLREKFVKERVLENELLSFHTTMKVGGPARIYFQTKDNDELIFLIKYANKYKIPYLVIGGGTNLVISDKGFDGLVIKNNSLKINLVKYGGKISQRQQRQRSVEVEVDSGVPVNQLVRYTLDQDLSGLEAFLGQPGTVGGAVYINAHNMKMGEYFGDKIVRAKILKEDGTILEVPRSYFQYGYDKSILQSNKNIVLSVTLKLVSGQHSEIWVKANEAMEHRKKTQPIGFGSAGCTFRNISKADALRIGTPNQIISAGYLIDVVGLKGIGIGGAKISDKHANFIINIGNATFQDVFSLIQLIKGKVKKRFGIELKEEVIIVGGET